VSQPLVLAIEPDPRQAAIVKRIVREKALADVTVVDSRDAAMEAMRTAMPDVLLMTALFSPRDEDELMAHLRTLDNAGHLQTHTIPQLASSHEPAEGRSRGLFSAFRRKKDTEQVVGGCDPDLFAEEIRVYLQRAADKKQELQNSNQPGVAGAAVRESRKAGRKKAEVVAETEAPASEASSWESPFEWKPSTARSTRSTPAPAPAAAPVAPAPMSAQDPIADAPMSAHEQIADAPLVESVLAASAMPEPLAAEPMATIPLSTTPIVPESLIIEPALVQPRALEPLIRTPVGETSSGDGSTDDRTIEYPVNDPWVVHAPRQITIAPDMPVAAAPPVHVDATPLILEVPPAAFAPTVIVEAEPRFVEEAPTSAPILYTEPEPEPEPVGARAEEPVSVVLEAPRPEPSHTPVHDRAVKIVARVQDEKIGPVLVPSNSDTEWTHDPRPGAARAGERLGPLARWARAEAARKPKSEGVTADDVRALIASLAVPAAVASVTYPKGCRIRRVRVPPAPDGEAGESVGAVILSRRALADERDKQTTA